MVPDDHVFTIHTFLCRCFSLEDDMPVARDDTKERNSFQVRCGRCEIKENPHRNLAEGRSGCMGVRTQDHGQGGAGRSAVVELAEERE